MRSSDISAAEVIRILDLEPLPVEGGFYRVTYTGFLRLPGQLLGPAFRSDRQIASVIYYLLTRETHSRLHSLPTDEMWHFYLGDPVELHVFGQECDYTKTVLGHDLAGGQTLQAVAPAGTWFGACLQPEGRWALMACSLAPAYDEQDFALPDGSEYASLLARFPACGEVLAQLR